MPLKTVNREAHGGLGECHLAALTFGRRALDIALNTRCLEAMRCVKGRQPHDNRSRAIDPAYCGSTISLLKISRPPLCSHRGAVTSNTSVSNTRVYDPGSVRI